MKHLSKLFSYGNNDINFSNIDFNKNFNPGLSLKKLREEFGINQTEIYKNKNIKQSQISNIEQGNRYPDIDTLLIYSDVLKINYFDVLTAILNDYKDFLLKESIKVERVEKSLKESIAVEREKMSIIMNSDTCPESTNPITGSLKKKNRLKTKNLSRRFQDKSTRHCN